MAKLISMLCLLVVLLMPTAAKAEAAYEQQVIEGLEIAEAAQSYVKQQLANEAELGEVTVERISLPNRAYIPAGSVSYAFEIPQGVRYNSPTNVYVSLLVNGAAEHKALVQIRVRQYKEVAVLNRAIPVKAIIQPADIRLERMDVSRLGAGYITDAASVIGLQAKRVLSNGTVLLSTMLTQPNIIEYAAMVKIVSRINGAEISVDGQAMQAGRRGQNIRVRNMVTKKIIMAKIIDASTVEVLNR